MAIRVLIHVMIPGWMAVVSASASRVVRGNDSPPPLPETANDEHLAERVDSRDVWVLEGGFGRVELDTARPALIKLTLRRADGSPEPHPVLSPKGHAWIRGMPDWGTDAYTFAADDTGHRFESRNQAPESVERTNEGCILRGVLLADKTGESAAREDWTVAVEGDDLVWTIERTWLRHMTASSTGSPALFFSNRPVNANPSTVLPNAVATTFWIAPEHLRGWFNPHYRPGHGGNDFTTGFPFIYKIALANNVVVTEPGGWGVLKLFTAWENESEPRLEAEVGHLYRRGHYGWLSESGIVSHSDRDRMFQVGDTERTVLRLSTVSASSTGHQLVVEADDPDGTIAALRGFYGGLLNGGCVNDALHYNFGNETDGWYYAGASWMKGLALLAGAPAPRTGSSRPHSPARAFRDNLRMIAGTESEPGLTRFGYNYAGAYVDDNINQIIGGRAYYLHSGDLTFVRQHLPFYRRVAAWYLARRDADGLVSIAPAHWYYDAMYAEGVTTYHNAFLYRALLDLAGLERAAGNAEEATRYEVEAAALKHSINRVLWWEDAPGGPRYVDWILSDGTKIAYAADLCQFPPVAFGIASPDQAKRLLETLDRRIAELERDHGYAGYASRSAYWPVPEQINSHPINREFGSYMNGGSFLSMTYWEIMARCAAGDAEGAWQRLRRFAEGTRLTGTHGYIGNNWVMQDGRIGWGAGDEPYLSDAIAVPAALVQGILGVRHTNEGLDVNPVLSPSLRQASVEVVHLGTRKRVTINGSEVKIEDLGRVSTPPDELTWHVDAGCPPEAALEIDRTFDTGIAWSASPAVRIRLGQGVGLRRVPTTPLAGLWKLDDEPGDTAANGSENEADGTCNGVVFQALDRHGKPAAARFQSGAQVVVGNIAPFTFGPEESFTVQAWFQTASRENQVIAARQGAWSLGVKEGRLAAWVMQDGGQFVESVGATPVADGRWYHAAAVVDRQAGTIAVFLDGMPDSVPLDITGIGASGSPAPVTLGAFGGSFPFDGVLDEISVHHAALEPASFSYHRDYDPVPPAPLGAQTGSYTTAPCDWGQPVRVTSLRAATAHHDGSVRARLETSNDGFETIVEACEIPLPDGEHIRSLEPLAPARYARVVFSLETPPDARHSPVLSAVRLTGMP